jgi:hypothetical protein
MPLLRLSRFSDLRKKRRRGGTHFNEKGLMNRIIVGLFPSTLELLCMNALANL